MADTHNEHTFVDRTLEAFKKAVDRRSNELQIYFPKDFSFRGHRVDFDPETLVSENRIMEKFVDDNTTGITFTRVITVSGHVNEIIHRPELHDWGTFNLSIEIGSTGVVSFEYEVLKVRYN